MQCRSGTGSAPAARPLPRVFTWRRLNAETKWRAASCDVRRLDRLPFADPCAASFDAIRPHLPAKHSPLQHSGDGLQSVYLAAIADSMADVLASMIGQEFLTILGALAGELDETEHAADQQEEAIQGRIDKGATTKVQLNARRGQGVFKANVRLNEKGCRMTGVSDPLYLRASHIKPWKESSDEEKLNGCNGLLLAPHIDHLFDRG